MTQFPHLIGRPGISALDQRGVAKSMIETAQHDSHKTLMTAPPWREAER